MLTILGVLLFGCVHPCLAAHYVALHAAPVADAWTNGVARGLCPETEADCRVDDVFLGPAWEGEDFFEERFEHLRPDWAGRTPDAVVADGAVAFAFARKYRGELFGDAPLVYLGMDAPDESLPGGVCGRCAGVPLRLGVKATVDLIFHLLPDTTTLVVVMDDAVENEALRQRVEAAMEPHLDRATVIFPGNETGDDNGLDAASLANVASSVPRAGAVLFLGFAVDNAGNGVDEAEMVRTLVERSPAPVYVLTDRWLGLGVLGGVLARGQDQARAAASLATLLIRRPAGEVTSAPVAPRPAIDATVLARFGIPADRLPENSLTINPVDAPQPPDPLATPSPWLLALLLAVPALLLLRYRHRRKR